MQRKRMMRSIRIYFYGKSPYYNSMDVFKGRRLINSKNNNNKNNFINVNLIKYCRFQQIIFKTHKLMSSLLKIFKI
jgi:hypothetical protein